MDIATTIWHILLGCGEILVKVALLLIISVMAYVLWAAVWAVLGLLVRWLWR